MSGLPRALDTAAAAAAATVLVILATGGGRIGGIAFTRPEDALLVLVGILAARALVAPVCLPLRHPHRAVVIGAVAYVALMGFVVVSRHAALRTHALDLGYYVQVLWNIAHGFGARVSLPPMHAWGDHFSPVLYLMAPLGLVVPGAPALLIAQTVIVAAGAFAVFRFARLHVGDERVAAGFALVYLVNPSLHGINIRDVHPAAFAIPLLVAAAVAFDTRRAGWCAVALVLTLGAREDATVAVAGFGVWLALARRRWVAGAAIAAGCVVLLWIDINVVIPYFRGEAYPHLVRYAHLGGSLPEILVSLVLRPGRWLGVVLTVDKAVYLLALLAPLAFLPLLAPRAFAAAVPGLAMNLLSTDPVLFNPRTQYQSFVLPFLFIAAVEGYRNLVDRRAGRLLFGRWPVEATVAAAVLAAVALTSRTVNDLGIGKWRLDAGQRALHAMIAAVPPLVPVSVNERIVPHLAARPGAYVYPTALARSQYVIELAAVVDKQGVPGWDVVMRNGEWLLLRRAAR